MRADPPVLALLLALLLAAQPGLALAQAPAQAPPASAPVIACTSLANLRAVLRGANGDAAAAVPVITDPKSDLGCSVLDRSTVTAIADHVALNGHAYDCLALQGTSVCHWTVAGAVKPPSLAPADKPAADKPPADKPAAGKAPGGKAPAGKASETETGRR